MDLLKQRISELFIAHPEGFPLSQLSSLYQQIYEQPLQLSDCGLHSLLSMMEHMKDVISLQCDGQNLMIIPVDRKRSIKYGCPPIGMSEDFSLVNQPEIQVQAPELHPDKKQNDQVLLLKIELQNLLKCYSQGIRLGKLTTKYRKRYKKELKSSDYGFQSIEDMVESMCDVLSICPGAKNSKVIARKKVMTNMAKANLQIPIASFCLSETQSVNDFSSELPSSLLQPPHPKSSSVELMEHIRKQILELFVTEPNGIPETKLCEYYCKKYRQNLKTSTYGFNSIKELLASMNDVLDVEHVPNLGNVVKLKSTQAFAISKDKENKTKMAMSHSTLAVSRVEIPNISSCGPWVIPRASNLQAPVLVPGLPTIPVRSNYCGQPLNSRQLISGPTSQITFGPPENKVTLPSQSMTLSVNSSEINAKLKSNMEEETSKKNPLSISFFDQLVPCGKTNSKVQLNDTLNQSIDGSGGAWQRSASPGLSSVSSDDFPSLDMKVTKEKLRKLKEEELKKKRLEHRNPQDYFAQLREEHRSVMQAVELMASDNLFHKGNRHVNLEDVNQRVEEFIRALAADGEYVTEEKVLNRVCRYFRVQNIKNLGIWPPIKLPAIRELRQIQRELVTFIEAFESTRCVCTLYELNQCLAALKNKQSFEELNLGPLCKQPLVHRIFKVPQSLKDEDIYEIETVDILQSLNSYRRSVKGYKIDLAEFIKYLADKYHCDSPYDLGIRITSIGLSISTLSKSVNSERAALEKARNRVQQEMEEEVQNRMNKIKKNLLDPASGPQLYSTSGCLDLRKQYASNTAAEAVLKVFMNAKDIFSDKMAKYIQEFLMKVGDNRLARSLFQLAICCGSLEVPQDLVAKEKPSKSTANGSGDKETQLPTEGSVREYLERNLSSVTGYLNLVYLSRLEKKLVEHFKLKGFVAMGHGTFLEYLVKHPQLLEEAAGGNLFLQPQVISNCGFRPSHQDVYEFIKQCITLEESMFPAIEAALRSQFRVKDSKELGYGTLSNMIKMVRRQAKLHTDYSSFHSLVRYEATLFVKEASYCNNEINHSVGVLGDLSKDHALTCLLNTPLLEDLAEWSQWELVFEPQHGLLKDFIERHCGKKSTQLSVEGLTVLNDLIAIETKPGVLLRLTTDTSPEHFAYAVKSHDPIGTAGHLISIVTADGLRNAPLALLANHVESALATLGSSAGNDLEDERLSSDRAARFILDCIIRLPIRLCKSLLQKVFLEPFSRVVGQSESKELLLQTAKYSFRVLNRLHKLGLLLGITDWMKDYHVKLDPAHLVSIVSKPLKNIDPVSLSSHSSYVALSDAEDSDIDAGSKSTSASSVAEDDDDDDEKFVLADEAHEMPLSEDTDDAALLNLTNQEECSLDAINEEENSHKLIIEDIRKNEFGIGIELNDEGKKLMQVHQNRLGRSLERLSTELYSKDTHFVLELIQNADDNSYPPFDDDTSPSLLFVVETDCIILLNNECGFKEKNIRAICDVGCSTKGKHKFGYIGQKGIGFKSVFKVTDIPEIHSNGFHICFNKLSGPMGYILPHWIDDKWPVELMGSDAEKGRWTTKIVLPLKPQNRHMQNLFHDIDPSLLLFLHRLRSITIINKIKGQDFLVTRKDLGNNILEVKHKTGADHWLVIKSSLDAKKIKDDVECTELALAFKLDSEKRNQGSRSQPEKQPVFAFLPLRSFGFRFIIQGDFDIPSSREDIDRDSPWNQWLRSEIPQLFLKAMETFSSHPRFEGLEGLRQFLAFIPLLDEILDFFQPVAVQIIQKLKAKSCLPTTEDQDGRIEFRLPSQIAVTHDFLIQEVVTPELLEKHLNLAYINPVLQSTLSPALASALGIHKISTTDIIEVTKAIAKEVSETNSIFNDEIMKKIAKLLVCNYRSLEQEYRNLDQFLEDLRSVPIIPLADGSMASLKDQAIFFPLYDKENEKFAMPTPGLQDLYLDLKTIHPSVLTCLDDLGNSQVRKLLEKMDVHYLKPDKVMYEHILPILKEQKWKNKPQGIVISYSVFLKMHCQDNELQQFRPDIPVLTNRGFTSPLQVNINFSRDYKNFINLPVDLPGVDWVLLDSCYLKTDNDSEGWRTFFSSLGVRDSFIFQKKKCTFTKQELATSPWAPVYECWPSTADNLYVVEDYVCEELHRLLTTGDLSELSKLNQRKYLLKHLDKNWDSGSRLSQYCTAKVYNSQDKVLRNDVDSSFAIYLKTLPWLPTDSPALDGSGFHTAFLRPIEVYLRSENLLELLDNNVSYVCSDLLEKSTFAAFTGIKTSITVETMINHFKLWCVKSPPSNSGDLEGAEFCTGMDHICKVYAYLDRNCSQNQLKDLFERYPAVFVPSRSESICIGQFYHQKDVCWKDPTRMFERYKYEIQKANGSFEEPHLLAPFYGNKEDMKGLFLKRMNIEKIPSMKYYVNLLVLVCGSVTLPNNSVLQDVSLMYTVLAEKCKNYGEYEDSWDLMGGYCQTLKGMIKNERIFPAKDNRWVSMASSPIIPDDKLLERIFKAQPLCLLTVPAPARHHSCTRNNSKQEFQFNEEDRNLFFDICGIKRLSSCVTVEAQTVDLRQSPHVQNFVRSLTPFIQRWFYHHSDFNGVYKELQDSNIVSSLKSTCFYQVGKLYLHYHLTLPDAGHMFEKEDVVCHLDKKTFYVQKNYITSYIDICRELVKLFSHGNKQFEKELERFVQSLVSCLEDTNTLKRFLKKEDVGELPEDEEKWEVPLAAEMKLQPQFIEATIPMQSQSMISTEVQKNKDDSVDEEKTLASWPPKSSLYGFPGAKPNKAADSVMKIWPPPAPTSDSVDKELSGSHHPPPAPAQTGGQSNFLPTSGPKPTADPGQSLEHQKGQNFPSSKEHVDPLATSEQKQDSSQTKPMCPQPTENKVPDCPPAANSHSSQESSMSRPGTNRTHFTGAPTNTFRAALPLDDPVWNKEQPHEEALEELEIHDMVERPAVLFNEDKLDNLAIGKWGESLVHAFLLHWKESDSELKPSAVSWVNENGESGLPYDFKVMFGMVSQEDTFIEVKSTIRAEKNFVQLSAQEMELALKAKDHYHLYRVYKAGDSQHVKLCRIKNLAQCLHAKQLELFLCV
ncbi:uncharacterized protein [Narcine bancroftii]|uniref:uncharacterized protein isoform X2 n=1 Tax=Narcine bancroftii TaxID=1343680 RepID=UPI003831E98D